MTGVICFSIATPAFAKTSDEILDEQKSFTVNQVCEGRDRTQRAYGKCIGDALKRINMLRDEFNDALEIERTEWYESHSHLGVSAEYSQALKEFTTGVTAKRKLFSDQQRAAEKVFFAAQKTVRQEGLSSSSNSSRSSLRPVKATDEKAAALKCAKVKDDNGKRLCIRQQLRLLNPGLSQMGAASGRTRGQ